MTIMVQPTYSLDPDVITEDDIDWVGEIRAADAEAQEVIDEIDRSRREVIECCGGRDVNCGHHWGYWA